MMSAIAAQNSRLPPRFNSHSINPQATKAIAMNSHRCHPSAVARKLNAAPALNASTRLKNEVTIHSSPGRNAARIAYLVI